MFQTLKAQSGALGDMEYVIQSSLPADGKVRGSKKQPACTRCKMKKLKCILDADSCEKCVESGVTCSYGGSRRPASGSVSSASGTNFTSGGSSSSGASSVDNGGMNQANGGGDTTIIISPVGSSSKAASPRDQVTQTTSGGSVSRNNPATNSAGPSNSTSNSKRSGSSSRSNSSTGSEIHVDTSTCMTPMSQSIQDACHSDSLDTVMDTPSFMADLTGSAPVSAAAAYTQDEMHAAGQFSGDMLDADSLDEFGICFCTDLIIAANATMQVRLVWTTWLNGGTTCTSSIEDILQCQKNVLASCDTFFQCKRCSLKPDYVVLVISMCREMVDGVRALQHITSPSVLRSRRGLQGHQLNHHHTGPDGGGASSSGKPRVDAGGWQLDDDDEIEIIRHLIQVRTTKLRNLVGQVEQAVNVDHASYGWMVGNLRKSLDEKLGSGSGLHVP